MSGMTHAERFLQERLLDDDSKWDSALTKACDRLFPAQIRQLFIIILKECKPKQSISLWNKFKNDMIQDLIHEYKIAYNVTTVPMKDLNDMYETTLYEIYNGLEQYNRNY